jgi:DnaK suppressor protein
MIILANSLSGRDTRATLQAGVYAPVAPIDRQGEQVDEDKARALVQAKRAEVQSLLETTEREGRQDRATEDEQGADISDPAQPLTAQFENEAITATLRDRLAALDRAEQRLDDGTYGRSVESGLPIPDERLEADPAAELTIEEAEARS